MTNASRASCSIPPPEPPASAWASRVEHTHTSPPALHPTILYEFLESNKSVMKRLSKSHKVHF